ncbi:hypothetical protein B0H34DRAFT_681437 [Crassisporium funariophilum]|nr:hypothetical protein B0H34DRAFT_681437 [Crassisporium funariophilum]
MRQEIAEQEDVPHDALRGEDGEVSDGGFGSGLCSCVRCIRSVRSSPSSRSRARSGSWPILRGISTPLLPLLIPIPILLAPPAPPLPQPNNRRHTPPPRAHRPLQRAHRRGQQASILFFLLILLLIFIFVVILLAIQRDPWECFHTASCSALDGGRGSDDLHPTPLPLRRI